MTAEVKAWTEVPFLHPPAELRKDGILKTFNKALSRKAEGQTEVEGSIGTSKLVRVTLHSMQSPLILRRSWGLQSSGRRGLVTHSGGTTRPVAASVVLQNGSH